jgi:hypothetical protein
VGPAPGGPRRRRRRGGDLASGVASHDQEGLTNVVFLDGQAMVVSTLAADESPVWYLVSRPGLVKATLADAPDRIRTGQFAFRS